MIENSWARRGGMDDCIEVYGKGGVTYADLHMGNALPTYSEYGFRATRSRRRRPPRAGPGRCTRSCGTTVFRRENASFCPMCARQSDAHVYG